MGLAVGSTIASKINGYGSFLVAPDGSNEGWADSEAGDGLRAAYRRWLREQSFGDGSSSLEWCEVEYGSDPGGAEVVASQWEGSENV